MTEFRIVDGLLAPVNASQSAPNVPLVARVPRGHTCRICREAIGLYESGLGLVAVGGRLGVSEYVVARSLRIHGISIRPRGGPQGFRTVSWHEEAIRRFRAGETAALIGLSLGVSRERVRQVLHQNGIPQTRQPFSHVCDEACRAVLAAQEPIAVLPLARATGIIAQTLRRRARAHGLNTKALRGTHRCDDRCNKLLDGLGRGLSVHAAAIQAAFSYSHVLTNIKVYHPAWPWPGIQRRRHVCGEQCRLARLALAEGKSYWEAGRISGLANKIYSPRFRSQHADLPPPRRLGARQGDA